MSYHDTRRVGSYGQCDGFVTAPALMNVYYLRENFLPCLSTRRHKNHKNPKNRQHDQVTLSTSLPIFGLFIQPLLILETLAGCLCFFFSLHIHKVVYSPTGMCVVQPKPRAGILRASLKGSLQVARSENHSYNCFFKPVISIFIQSSGPTVRVFFP